MKKCKGCGIPLQCEDKEKVGYVVDMEQDYCQRCFRLSHYGDTSHLKTNHVSNEKIFEIYRKYANGLFVVIVDALDGLVLEDDDLLEIFKDYDVLLIINKTDLFPANINEEKIASIFSKMLFKLNKKYPNIRSAIMTNKFENRFNDQFFETIEQLKARNVIFAGRANAGKSSLINKLLHNDFLTTSIYPGTTLEEIEIDYRDHIFIDTPGLVDMNNYSTYLNSEKYKLSKIDKTSKPQVFQFNEEQSYFYEGLLRVDVIPKNKGSISFYICNNNEIHRTKLENADSYYQKNYASFRMKVKPLKEKRYKIDCSRQFLIKGLGLFKVNGKMDIIVHSLADVNVYDCEVEI